jgi:hypothetical protein
MLTLNTCTVRKRAILCSKVRVHVHGLISFSISRDLQVLEVDRSTTLTCVASVVTAQHPEGRVVANTTLRVPAGAPRGFLLTGLVPRHTHVIMFSGATHAMQRNGTRYVCDVGLGLDRAAALVALSLLPCGTVIH